MLEMIPLGDGKTISNAELRDFFVLVMEAERSGEPFPVDFDYVWHFAYSTKANAKRALIDSDELFENEDYHIIKNDDMVKRLQGGGIQPEKIFISVPCLEFFIARKVRPIFEIYRQCRKLVFEKARFSWMPYHIRRYVTNHPQVPFGYFSILQQMTMHLVAPLEIRGVTLAENVVPDISEGRMFCKWLREEKGVDPDSFPNYMHEYEDGRKVPARLYPLNLLTDYIEHYQNQWLNKHADTYFKKRDNRVLPLLPTLLGLPTQQKLLEDERGN